MKENIELFGEDFKKQISNVKKEEDNVRKLEIKYKKSLDKLNEHKEKRINAINEIRLTKVQEINDELEITKPKLEKLNNERQELLYEYCKKFGHKDILIKSEYRGYTGAHSFKYGRAAMRTNAYKCAVCGRKTGHTSETYGVPSIKQYKQIIPSEIYDDTSLNKDGKTLRVIEEEIQKVQEYINYLEMLKIKMCELFGHDAKPYYNEEFVCNCCNRIVSYREYINTYHNAKYRGIVPFYYSIYPEMNYIISSEGKLTLSLPTYKSYQRTLKKK